MNNRYIHTPTKSINIKLHEGKPLPKTLRTKRSDVPLMYRRSIAKDILSGIGILAFALAVLNCILFFATIL